MPAVQFLLQLGTIPVPWRSSHCSALSCHYGVRRHSNLSVPFWKLVALLVNRLSSALADRRTPWQWRLQWEIGAMAPLSASSAKCHSHGYTRGISDIAEIGCKLTTPKRRAADMYRTKDDMCRPSAVSGTLILLFQLHFTLPPLSLVCTLRPFAALSGLAPIVWLIFIHATAPDY